MNSKSVLLSFALVSLCTSLAHAGGPDVDPILTCRAKDSDAIYVFGKTKDGYGFYYKGAGFFGGGVGKAEKQHGEAEVLNSGVDEHGICSFEIQESNRGRKKERVLGDTNAFIATYKSNGQLGSIKIKEAGNSAIQGATCTVADQYKNALQQCQLGYDGSSPAAAESSHEPSLSDLYTCTSYNAASDADTDEAVRRGGEFELVQNHNDQFLICHDYLNCTHKDGVPDQDPRTHEGYPLQITDVEAVCLPNNQNICGTEPDRCAKSGTHGEMQWRDGHKGPINLPTGTTAGH